MLTIKKEKKKTLNLWFVFYIVLSMTAFFIGHFYLFSKTVAPVFVSREASNENKNDYLSLAQEKIRIHGYLSSISAGAIEFYLTNIDSIDTFISAIQINDSLIKLDELTFLPKLEAGKVKTYSKYKISIDEKYLTSRIEKIILHHSAKKQGGRTFLAYISLYNMAIDSKSIPNLFSTKHVYYRKLPYIKVVSNNIYVQSGVWTVEQNLIIPPGYVVNIKPGTTLNLKRGASVVSLSPVHLEGKEESSIIINCGEGSSGFAVIKANEKSIIKHTTFNKCSSPEIGVWTLTGAVTFFESPVDIISSKFYDNNSEDSLNVVRSTFNLINSQIYGTTSDAFDGDFVEGNILNSQFSRCGNDCIDFSGSDLIVNNVDILSAGDKGISIGEKSKARITNSTISNSNIGIASKDSSVINADNLVLNKNNIALTAYQKKSEYTGGMITISKSVLEDNQTQYLIETGSSIISDNIKGVTRMRNVYKYLEGEEK